MAGLFQSPPPNYTPSASHEIRLQRDSSAFSLLGLKKNREANMRKLLGLTAFGIALMASAVAQPSFAACTARHMYNNSTDNWTFTVTNGSTTCDTDGVHFMTSCTVAPGHTMSIHYDNYWAGGNNKFKISSEKYYVEQQFTVNVAQCYIYTDNSGNVAMNEPAGGDISTCGSGDYACKAK